MTDPQGSVVVLSGGMDSATLLWHELAQGKRVRALSFDYNQRHCTEIDAAADLAQRAEVPWDFIDISGVGEHLRGSSQTDRDVEVPHGHYTDETMKKTVVPNRNMIFLSIATGYAIGHGCGRVAFAAHSGDHAIYPDCRTDFVRGMQGVVSLATEWTPVSLEAPFVEISKADIAKLGHELGVPFELTWSCYEGNRDQGHCGKCGTCVERREAFELAGVEDPTRYRA